MLRRLLSAFVIVVLLCVLAACGGIPAAGAPSAAPSSAASVAAEPSVVPASAAAETQPSAAPVAAESEPAASATAGETRTIVDASGAEVEVPAAPARVVALTEHDLDSALALGITPVGSVNGRGQAGLPAYLGERISGIESVGSLAEPSLEKLVALDPDLILAGNLIPQIEALLPELQEIAPVIKTYEATDDWKAAFGGTAAALNREAVAEAFLVDYQERAAEIRARLPAGEAQEASVVRWMPEGPVVMVPTTFSSLVLADIGLTRPAAHAELAGGHGAHSEPLSLEQLETVDSDWMFVGTLNPDGQAALDTARENALFQQLDVVKQRHVVAVDGAVWTSVGGPLAALTVLDDVERALAQAGAGAAEPAAATGEATFPVTIEHKFGNTTITAEPQRVVSLGYSEQDPVLALGVVPVAVRDWFGDQPNAVWPWAQDELGDAAPEVLKMPFGELNFETIAALNPDLIVATHSGITAEEYQTLAQIAPVLAQPDAYPDFGVPWQEQTRLIGRALGRGPRADELVAAVEAQIAAARTANTAFEGATVAWATPAEGTQFWAVGPNTPPMRFLADLGFSYPDSIAAVVGDQDSAQISAERIDLLDVDVLIIRAATAEERAAVESNPLYQQLDVAGDGRTLFFVGPDDPVYGALSFSTVLSLPYAVEEIVPELAGAVADK